MNGGVIYGGCVVLAKELVTKKSVGGVIGGGVLTNVYGGDEYVGGK